MPTSASGIPARCELVRDGERANVAELVKDGVRLATTMGSADVEGLGATDVTAINVFAQSDPGHFVWLPQIASEGALTVP